MGQSIAETSDRGNHGRYATAIFRHMARVGYHHWRRMAGALVECCTAVETISVMVCAG